MWSYFVCYRCSKSVTAYVDHQPIHLLIISISHWNIHISQPQVIHYNLRHPSFQYNYKQFKNSSACYLPHMINYLRLRFKQPARAKHVQFSSQWCFWKHSARQAMLMTPASHCRLKSNDLGTGQPSLRGLNSMGTGNCKLWEEMLVSQLASRLLKTALFAMSPDAHASFWPTGAIMLWLVVTSKAQSVNISWLFLSFKFEFPWRDW